MRHHVVGGLLALAAAFALASCGDEDPTYEPYVPYTSPTVTTSTPTTPAATPTLPGYLEPTLTTTAQPRKVVQSGQFCGVNDRLAVNARGTVMTCQRWSDNKLHWTQR